MHSSDSEGCNHLNHYFNAETTAPQNIEIYFKVQERGTSRSAGSLWVDPSDTRELQRVVRKYVRKAIHIRDKSGRLIKTCFEDAIAAGTVHYT